MKKFIKFAGVLIAVIGMFSSITPAHAVSDAMALFVGSATTTPLGYPCTPVDVPPEDCPPGAAPPFAFTLSTTACVGIKTNILSPKTTTTSGTDCSINAAGTGAGYCGLSTGNGTGQIAYSGLLGSYVLTFNFSFVGVGGTLVVTGTSSNNGLLAAAIEAIPNPSSGSCTDGTATDFIIVGAATINSTE